MSDLTIPQLENKLLHCVDEAEKSGKVWADKKSFYESLDDKKKPYLAVLMNKFQGSNAAKEAKALADGEYKIFLDGLAVARNDFYQSQVAYDMARLKIDALRTIISARKEEVKNFRG